MVLDMLDENHDLCTISHINACRTYYFCSRYAFRKNEILTINYFK